MRKIRGVIFAIITPVLLGVCLVMSLAPGQVAASTGVNQEMSFEGKLVNSSGDNIADGTYNMEFKIYTAAGSCNPTTGSGCTLGWTEDWLVSNSQAVTTTSGTFQVNLDSVAQNNFSGIDFNTYPLYLSIQVGSSSSCTPAGNFTSNCGGDGEMKPYILLTSTPYALNAGKLGGISSSGFAQLSPGSQQSGSLNVSGNITSGGTLQVSTLDTPSSGTLTVGSTNTTGITLAKNSTVSSSATFTIQGHNALNLGSTTAAGGLLFQDGTANNYTVTLGAAAMTGSYSLTLPTSAPSTSQCLQSGPSTASQLVFGSCGSGGGANTALSNLSSVAINTSLLPGTSNSIDLGSSSAAFRNLFIGTGIQTTASTNLLLAPTTGIVAIDTASEPNELRVFENASSPTNYASITATHTSATFESASGITDIGNGTGAITLSAGSSAAVNITGNASSVWQTTAGSLSIQSGSTVSVLSNTTSSVTVDSGSTGDVDLGISANNKNVNVGAVGTTSANSNVSIATSSAGNETVTLGSTNGTSATTIQGGSGNITLNTSTGGSVQIGSSSANSSITLLVLDSYNQATDPTGIAGAMYYNTSLGRFRCYQNSTWTNCSGTSSEFGDGSDGAVTYNGSSTILGMAPASNVYTLTRDIYCTNITINSGVTIKTAGFRIFATGNINNSGSIQNNGNAGGNATSGAVGAAGAAQTNEFYIEGTAGAAGGSAAVGGAGTAAGTSTTFGAVGGAGGTNTNAGGAAGTVSAPAAAIGGVNALKVFTVAVSGALHNSNATTVTAGIGGGTGGGGGGSSSTANRGGGGGAGGGIVFIAAQSVTNSGTITATGGAGGNGNASGGVGGGGGGGVVLVFTSSFSGTTPTAAGGAIGSTGTTTGAAAGTTGMVLVESI